MACLFKTLQGNTGNNELPVFGQLQIQINAGRTYCYLDGIQTGDVSLSGEGHFEDSNGNTVAFKVATARYISTESGCVLVINNKYALTRIVLNYAAPVATALNDIGMLENLPVLDGFQGISTFFGNVTSVNSLKECVSSSVSCSGSGPLTIDISKLIEFKTYSIAFRSGISDVDTILNADLGLDEVTAKQLESLQLNGAYSYGTTRNDSSYKVLKFISLVLDNEESVANYILSLANCVPGRGTLGAITVNCRTAISSGFRSRTDIRNAVWNLMYNMFANLGDTERTPGTYYTKVTVAGVDVSPLQPE